MDELLETLRREWEEDYKAACMPPAEKIRLQRALKEYTYTLYYYGRAGNLIQTVPPEGVDLLSFADVQNNVAPGHELVTRYTYNSLNQPVPR